MNLEQLKEKATTSIVESFVSYCPKSKKGEKIQLVLASFQAKTISMIAEVILKQVSLIEAIEFSDEDIDDISMTVYLLLSNRVPKTTNQQNLIYSRAIAEYSKEFMAPGIKDNPSIDSGVKLLAGYVQGYAQDELEKIKASGIIVDDQDAFVKDVYKEALVRIWNRYSSEKITKDDLEIAKKEKEANKKASEKIQNVVKISSSIIGKA